MVQNTFDNYNRMGDVATIAICCVIFVLLATSYISRTRSFRIFCVLVGVLLAAAILNIGYHDMLILSDPAYNTWIYLLRIVYVVLLFNAFFLFTLYTTVVSNLERRKARIVAITATVLLVMFVASDIFNSFILITSYLLVADVLLRSLSNNNILSPYQQGRKVLEIWHFFCHNGQKY